MRTGLCCGEPHLEDVSVNGMIILKRRYKVVERGPYPCVSGYGKWRSVVKTSVCIKSDKFFV